MHHPVTCTKAVVGRTVDPLLVLERLLSMVGEIDAILVHQAEASSVLLCRHTQQMVVLVQPPHPKSKALWSPVVSNAWPPLLMAHWRVVDLIYTLLSIFLSAVCCPDGVDGDGGMIDQPECIEPEPVQALN